MRRLKTVGQPNHQQAPNPLIKHLGLGIIKELKLEWVLVPMMMFVFLRMVRFGYKTRMVHGRIMVQLVIILGQAGQVEEKAKTVINEKDKDSVRKIERSI